MIAEYQAVVISDLHTQHRLPRIAKREEDGQWNEVCIIESHPKTGAHWVGALSEEHIDAAFHFHCGRMVCWCWWSNNETSLVSQTAAVVTASNAECGLIGSSLQQDIEILWSVRRSWLCSPRRNTARADNRLKLIGCERENAITVGMYVDVVCQPFKI